MEPEIVIFLPFSWVTQHMPQEAWTSEEIRFNSPSCLEKCTRFEKMNFSLTWDPSVARDPTAHIIECVSTAVDNTGENVPLEFQQYVEIMSKEAADRLLEHRPYDCKIDLKEGIMAPWGPIYALSEIELQTCYTLNTTGSEFGYGPGRKVSETRHTVLGRHTETGQPAALGLGSGQPTLRHQEVPGPSTSADRESASAVAEEDNLGGHHEKDKQSVGNGNARSCEPRSRDRSGVVSRGAAQRNSTTSRESLYRRRRLGGSRQYSCTLWSGDTRDHATTRILVTDTR